MRRPTELTAIETITATDLGDLTAETLLRASQERIADQETVVGTWTCGILMQHSRRRARWMPAAPADRCAACRSVPRASSTRQISRPNAALPSMRGNGRPRTRPASGCRAALARSCSARPSPPNSRTSILGRLRTRTIRCVRQEARRAVRPPRSPTHGAARPRHPSGQPAYLGMLWDIPRHRLMSNDYQGLEIITGTARRRRWARRRGCGSWKRR